MQITAIMKQTRINTPGTSCRKRLTEELRVPRYRARAAIRIGYGHDVTKAVAVCMHSYHTTKQLHEIRLLLMKTTISGGVLGCGSSKNLRTLQLEFDPYCLMFAGCLIAETILTMTLVGLKTVGNIVR
jgi:hypothetical protein